MNTRDRIIRAVFKETVLTQYRRILETVTAWQWTHLVDLSHPLLAARFRGAVEVVPFVNEYVTSTAPCPLCQRPLSAHGQINPPRPPAVELMDPETGNDVNAPEPVDGVTLEIPTSETAVTSAPAAPEREEAKGYFLCPGDWIIQHPTGEIETCKPDRFPHEWVKA